MKKVKYGFLVAGLMIMSVSITGCGIKFIEKVEPGFTSDDVVVSSEDSFVGSDVDSEVGSIVKGTL